jgi:hypothetical protein
VQPFKVWRNPPAPFSLMPVPDAVEHGSEVAFRWAAVQDASGYGLRWPPIQFSQRRSCCRRRRVRAVCWRWVVSVVALAFVRCAESAGCMGRHAKGDSDHNRPRQCRRRSTTARNCACAGLHAPEPPLPGYVLQMASDPAFSGDVVTFTTRRALDSPPGTGCRRSPSLSLDDLNGIFRATANRPAICAA